MKKNATLAGLVCLLSACSTPANNASLPTQPNINLQRYAGTWYEQARLPQRFQNDCVGDVRADYQLNPDGSINVVNQCRTNTGEVKKAEAEGRLAKGVEPPDTAKLEVRFAPKWTSWLPMVWGSYWIIKTEGEYDYSLVGTPDRQYLWVLSRDKKADPRRVDALLEYARSLGFPIEEVVRDRSN